MNRNLNLLDDPVCGMQVDEASPWKTEYQGATYRFCARGCLEKFLGAPELYARGPQEPVPAPRLGADAAAKWKSYLPIGVIVLVTLLAAAARQAAQPGPWNVMGWMHDFMGFFLVVFSMFKFFDLRGFADGFQMYDLLAKHWRPYALVYPFIELALGLAYLAHWQPGMIYSITIAVMLFGAIGVCRALNEGRDLTCACLGTVLKVPLSTVALVEDFGMAAMAAGMLIRAL
ncbi:MAG: YHS domain-containing protein [Verrucomicrobiales bacterium]